MRGLKTLLLLILLAPAVSQAQQIVFSELTREDGRDMNFDIIGRVNKNILVFKNLRQRYSLNVYNDSMILKDKIDLDFIPAKAFNVEYVAYPDFFYLIYQHQKKGIVYCMAAKVDAEGKAIGDPVELDTTSIGFMGDSKIYSTIFSEDKKKIMIFKIQHKDEKLNFTNILYDNNLNLIRRSRQQISFNDRKEVLTEFAVDNEGNFAFVHGFRKNSRDNLSDVSLGVKSVTADTFTYHKLNLNGNYADEARLKVDNMNKRYVLTSFYYKERNGNIQGLWVSIWDAASDSLHANVFTEFDDDLKAAAKSSGNSKYAFNDFFIRNIILKRDGGFFLTAEDFSSQSSGYNNWNRYNYLYGSPYFSPYDYYFYSPYGYYYRPFNSFYNQSVRYYYDNVLVINFSKTGRPEWSNIIHKQQFADDNDNYLSFNIFNTGSEIHFLYNDISKREKLLSENIISPSGSSKRNPTLKVTERGYELMPRYAKQIGARMVIVPCTYRSEICFAKITF